MPLYYHLSSYEDISFSLLKALKYSLVAVFSCSRVPVHPKHPGSGEVLFYYFLYLLSTKPKGTYIRRSTLWAFIRHFFFIAAVMADQPVRSVKGKAYITVRTFDGFTTASTGNKACIPPSVDKQYDLLTLIKPVFYKLRKPPADY